MLFTFLNGAQAFAFFFIFTFRKPILVGTEVKHAINEYAYETAVYVYVHYDLTAL